MQDFNGSHREYDYLIGRATDGSWYAHIWSPNEEHVLPAPSVTFPDKQIYDKEYVEAHVRAWIEKDIAISEACK